MARLLQYFRNRRLKRGIRQAPRSRGRSHASNVLFPLSIENVPLMLAHWKDLTHCDFEAIDKDRAVALLPVAAIEQHGPHLPVSVDADINAGIIEAAARHLAENVPVYVLPLMPVGKSNEHVAFPGTLTLTASTVLALWTDLAESVIRTGFRRIVIFNTHGGQPQLVDVVVRDLRVRFGVLAVAANSAALGLPDGLFTLEEERFGIHAGAIETSMMLHLCPERVRMNLADDFPSAGIAIERNHQVLRLEGGIGIAWMTQDVHPSGAVGNASLAAAAHGAASIDFAGKRLAILLAEISAYPSPALETRT
jgi:creatinine amidohydrolase